MSKTMSLRLTQEQATDLETLARVDEISVSEEIRTAIDERIAARRKDMDFQARLQRSIERNQEALKRLAT